MISSRHTSAPSLKGKFASAAMRPRSPRTNPATRPPGDGAEGGAFEDEESSGVGAAAAPSAVELGMIERRRRLGAERAGRREPGRARPAKTASVAPCGDESAETAPFARELRGRADIAIGRTTPIDRPARSMPSERPALSLDESVDALCVAKAAIGMSFRARERRRG